MAARITMLLDMPVFSEELRSTLYPVSPGNLSYIDTLRYPQAVQWRIIFSIHVLMQFPLPIIGPRGGKKRGLLEGELAAIEILGLRCFLVHILLVIAVHLHLEVHKMFLDFKLGIFRIFGMYILNANALTGCKYKTFFRKMEREHVWKDIFVLNLWTRDIVWLLLSVSYRGRNKFSGALNFYEKSRSAFWTSHVNLLGCGLQPGQRPSLERRQGMVV